MPIANLFLALFTLLEPGYIGIRPAEITDATRREYKLAADVRTGLVLTKVWENSPAARAGLRAGDVLTSFDEKPVTTIATLQALVAKNGAGEKVAYVARRGSGTIAGLLVLGERPAAAPQVATGKEADLEKRMARLQKRIAKTHAEAVLIQKRNTKPASWIGYMEREERALVKAEAAKKVERVIWHKGRLALLREMGRGQVGSANRSAASKRVREMEERMEMILERLEMLEHSAKNSGKNSGK